MKEKPILFNGPMVRAILAGTKTQTRRLVTPGTSTIGSLPHNHWPRLRFDEPVPDMHGPGTRATFVDGGGFFTPPGTQYLHVPHEDGDTVHRVYPRIDAGDRLWVRETWYVDDFEAEGQGIHLADAPGPHRDAFLATLEHRADHDCRNWEAGCPCNCEGSSAWRPSIFMPRWASRITLDVTSVRVERLQSITETDAMAEGVTPAPVGDVTAFAAFRALWDSINAKRVPWSANPWVWVIGFKRASP